VRLPACCLCSCSVRQNHTIVAGALQMGSWSLSFSCCLPFVLPQSYFAKYIVYYIPHPKPAHLCCTSMGAMCGS
jgi:hypothetical protein